MRVDLDYHPILVLPCITKKKSIYFNTPSERFIIKGEWVKISKKVLKLCDGRFSASSIAELIKSDEKTVMDILESLIDIGVIVDSREQYKHFHRISNYPTAFLRNLTQDEIRHHVTSTCIPDKEGEIFTGEVLNTGIISLLNDRHSCRNFSQKKLNINQVLTLCFAGYGRINEQHYAVASAGGLYPLKLYVIVLSNQDGLPRGFYEYNHKNGRLIRYSDTIDIEQLKYAFNTENFDGSNIQLVVAGDLDRMGYKYANRAYRLCMIEVGHVAENITIAALEEGLSVCEMGGIQDLELKHELELRESVMPLLAITIGYEDNQAGNRCIDYASFIEKNVGMAFPVKSVDVWSDGGGFFTSTAVYYDGDTACVGGATARSDIFAKFKAVVEAYERWETFSGKGHVRPENSSGVAAHFDEKEAEMVALAELIERDAIMNCWDSKKSPYVLLNLSVHVTRRKQYWEKNKRRMEVLLLESTYAPVVMVVIFGEEYPYFVCGAASCVGNMGVNNKSLERIQNKALLEAESSLLFYLRNPEKGKAPNPKKIKSPEEHGKLYRMDRHCSDSVKWLLGGEEYTDEIIWQYSYEELCLLLQIKPTILKKLDNGLIVVRIESSILKRIRFGSENCKDGMPHFFS